MTQLQFELLRLGSRRDLRIVVVGCLALILIRELLLLRDLAAMANDPALPSELRPLQRQYLAGFSSPAGVATVVSNTAFLLFAVSGFLTCWTLGSEFALGTIRTALVVNPTRWSYLMGRLAGAAIVSWLLLALTAVVGMSMPLWGPAFGIDLGSIGDPSPSVALVLVAGLTSALAVALAGLLTCLLRSPVVSAGAFAASMFLAQTLESARLGEQMSGLLPVDASIAALNAASPPGALLLGQVAISTGNTMGAAASPITVLLAWTVALVLVALVVFRLRDVRE
jgi:hypothetical protein